MNIPGKKVAFHTLGCKLNFTETSTIARQLISSGYEKVPFSSLADIYIINTCSVTEVADKKCKQIINKTIKKFPDAFIIITGCFAQLKPEEISKIKGVDMVLGTNEKLNILSYLDHIGKKPVAEIYYCDSTQHTNFMSSFSTSERTRAFLKVQDGCDYKCTYCTIPLARGKSRNQTISKCIEDAKKIAATGTREIVITGVNIGDFGKSSGESFYQLLNSLLKIKQIERYRISSIEPNLLTDEIIELVAMNKQLLPHFHIPLQGGNNKMLSAMKRRYKRELFADRVSRIRHLIPYAGIGADIITGFPGETDNDFTDSYNFIESIDLSYLHVFSFSPRNNTPAASLAQQLSTEVKHKRSKKLQSLSEKKRLEFNRKCIGLKTEVLWESKDKEGIISGFTENYIRVKTANINNMKGEISEVLIPEMDNNGNFIIL